MSRSLGPKGHWAGRLAADLGLSGLIWAYLDLIWAYLLQYVQELVTFQENVEELMTFLQYIEELVAFLRE